MSTLNTQQGDVDLFQTPDDGEICITDGLVFMSGGLETAVYMSLFGGNEDDQGRKNDPLQWWGNLLESEPARKLRGATQHFVDAMPFSIRNILKVEEVVLQDLKWLLSEKIASEVLASVTVPEYNTMNIAVTVKASGEESKFNFVINWKNPPLERDS